MSDDRNVALNRIREHVLRYGQHIYLVNATPCPRYAYTIGLSERVGFELIFAGGAYFNATSVAKILNNVSCKIQSERDCKFFHIESDLQHEFTVGEVDHSWSSMMLLGAFDYYNTRQIKALQIIPVSPQKTIDVPVLSNPWNVIQEPIWRWLREEWRYPVSHKSLAVTNMDALKGGLITEGVRWEETEWELFAGSGPNVNKEDIRIVPLGTLLGADQSLEDVVHLAIGEGVWRDKDEHIWHPWRRRAGADQSGQS